MKSPLQKIEYDKIDALYVYALKGLCIRLIS